MKTGVFVKSISTPDPSLQSAKCWRSPPPSVSSAPNYPALSALLGLAPWSQAVPGPPGHWASTTAAASVPSPRLADLITYCCLFLCYFFKRFYVFIFRERGREGEREREKY